MNNLNGTHISVVGFVDPNYEIQLKSVTLLNGSVEFVGGFSFELFSLLQAALNFTYSPVNGEGWIDKLPNGTWTGIGRQVVEGEATLSITISSMLPYRLEAFNFLFPSSLGGLTVSLLQPPSHSIRNLVSSIFTFSVWISAFCTSALIFGLLKIVRLLKRQSLIYLQVGDERVLQESTFWILITFCQRSLMGNPSSSFLRIIYISILMTSLVGYVAFNASLVSVLSTENRPIRSFSDLLRSDLIIFGDSATSYTHSIIKGLNKDRKKSRPGSIAPSSLFVDVRSGVRAILEQGVVFATFEESLYTVYRSMNISEDYQCKNIFHFKVDGTTFPAGMFVKKGSPYKEPFNVKGGMLKERGLYFRLLKKLYGESQPRCSSQFYLTPSDQQRRRRLTFNDVITGFFALFVGVLGSFIIFLYELIWSSREACCKNKTKI